MFGQKMKTNSNICHEVHAIIKKTSKKLLETSLNHHNMFNDVTNPIATFHKEFYDQVKDIFQDYLPEVLKETFEEDEISEIEFETASISEIKVFREEPEPFIPNKVELEFKKNLNKQSSTTRPNMKDVGTETGDEINEMKFDRSVNNAQVICCFLNHLRNDSFLKHMANSAENYPARALDLQNKDYFIGFCKNSNA